MGADLMGCVVYDPNLQDFYRRIDRVEVARARGYGFEAVGTLGRSAHRRAPQRQWSILKPVLLVCMVMLALKGTIHHRIGAASYDQRVANLTAGDAMDRLGAFVMAADPVTLWVSDQIGRALR